jgi:protease I
MATLTGKKVAILVDDGFEEDELLLPRQALDQAGATTTVISPKTGQVKAWKHTDWGATVPVDLPLEHAEVDDFDALLLPGGVMNPDKLRADPQAVGLVRDFFDAGKPIAAICHGPWTLVEADVVQGLRMTSYASIRTDLENAGADWVDEPVVVDHGLVTSRQPSDIPAFNAKMIEEFAEGIDHERVVHAASINRTSFEG